MADARTYTPIWALIALLAAAGCGVDAPAAPGVDAGSAQDDAAAVAAADSGTVAVADASAASPADGALPAVDASTGPGLDAGVVAAVDAATVEPGLDASTTMSPGLDAGAAATLDAGLPGWDAGSAAADAGDCTAPAEWSFFVMSYDAIQRMSGSSEGFGGNLGGLSGADAKCQSAAEYAHGHCGKTWVAFLSVTNDGTGKALNAIDRIGSGPWHDVHGYLLASNKAGLLQTRPAGDSQTVVYQSGYQNWVFTNCLTTELGNCNHSYGDSHDTITGSKADGTLYSTDLTYTCSDWTSTTNLKSCDGTRNECWPAIGHTWPAQSGQGWLYSHRAGGCQANVLLTDGFENGIGGHGGYGAWYCFAVP
ncbi:MAG: hypothetical protein QM765_09030 [Myxococcales bacterium]